MKDVSISYAILLLIGWLAIYATSRTHVEYGWKSLGYLLLTFIGVGLIYTNGFLSGMDSYLGKPIPFTELGEEREYKIIKIVDSSYSLIQYKNSEPRFIKNIPKEVIELGEGATFKISSTTKTSIIKIIN